MSDNETLTALVGIILFLVASCIFVCFVDSIIYVVFQRKGRFIDYFNRVPRPKDLERF